MKIAVVTGASRGIGAAVADELLKKGWRVIGLGRSEPATGIEHVFCDLSKPADVDAVTKKLVKRCHAAEKNGRIDLVVCAAGIGKFASAEGFSTQQIEEIMRVNFTAHAILLGGLLPAMKKRQSGKIIAIGSEAALQGARLGSIYCASKFALRGYCQSLRAECRLAGIGVSLINPGLVRSGFHDRLHFEPAAGDAHALALSDVCRSVIWVTELPDTAVVEELNLQPMQPQVVKKP